MKSNFLGYIFAGEALNYLGGLTRFIYYHFKSLIFDCNPKQLNEYINPKKLKPDEMISHQFFNKILGYGMLFFIIYLGGYILSLFHKVDAPYYPK